MKLYSRFAGAVVVGDVEAAAFEGHRRGMVDAPYLAVPIRADHLGPVSVHWQIALEALAAFGANKAVTRHQ